MQSETVIVKKRAKKVKVEKTPKETLEAQATMTEMAPVKKPPTEKQLAARERQRVKREEKKQEVANERLRELYAQSAAIKAEEEKAAAEVAKKEAAAAKRREAAAKRKADAFVATALVVPELEPKPVVDFTRQSSPPPLKKKKTPFGFESTGITPIESGNVVAPVRHARFAPSSARRYR